MAMETRTLSKAGFSGDAAESWGKPIRVFLANPILRGSLLPMALLAVWQLNGTFGWIRLRLLPPPARVLESAVALARSGVLGLNLRDSLLRVVEGSLVGGILGLAGGIAMGGWRLGDRLLTDTFNSLRQVPVVGLVPLLVLWFGVGEPCKIAFIALGVFYPVALNTASGIRGVPFQYREVGRVYKLGRWGMLTRIVLPAALPSLKTGAIQGLNMAWVGLVAAELLTVTSTGLANIINEGRERFHMELVFVGLLVIAVAGFAMNWALLAGWKLVFRRFERQ